MGEDKQETQRERHRETRREIRNEDRDIEGHIERQRHRDRDISFTTKNLEKTGKGGSLHLLKGSYKKHTANIILHGKRLCLSPKIGNKQGYLPSETQRGTG